MASAEVLDFATLLQAIPGDNPAGSDLRKDLDPTSAYRVVRDARTQARDTEKRRIEWELASPEERDALEMDRPEPDWRPILELAPRILAEQSKDLEVASLLIEALVRIHGFAGLRDGFRLARELVDRYWDGLHPLPDEEGVATRVAHLTGLNGEETDGVLVGPIGRVAVTRGQSLGPFTLAQYRQALELERVDDPNRRARRLEQPGMVSLQQFQAAVSETEPEFFRDLLDDVDQCREQFRKLCGVLDERCGADPSGAPLAPPSSNIRNALEAGREDIRRICGPIVGLGQDEQPAAGGDAATVAPAGGPARGATAAAVGVVQTREDAFRAMLQLAEFFRRTEPHSPVASVLEMAVRYGRMPLPELLEELIRDDSARSQVFRQVGISPPKEND